MQIKSWSSCCLLPRTQFSKFESAKDCFKVDSIHIFRIENIFIWNVHRICVSPSSKGVTIVFFNDEPWALNQICPFSHQERLKCSSAQIIIFVAWRTNCPIVSPEQMDFELNDMYLSIKHKKFSMFERLPLAFVAASIAGGERQFDWKWEASMRSPSVAASAAT